MKSFTELPFHFEQYDTPESPRDELAHWHHSIELIQILEGSFCCHVDGQQFIAKQGDICIINRDSIHRILDENKELSSPCRKKSLIFNPDDIVSNGTIYNQYIQPLLHENAFSHMQFHSNKGIGKEIVNLIEQIEGLIAEKPLGYEVEAIALVYMILRRLYLAYETKEHHSRANMNSNLYIQRKMAAFIYENFDSKLTLEEIANSGKVSKSTCIRLFKEYTGKSVIDFLNSYRLEISTKHILSGQKNITEIAQECGFAQQSYFNKLFKKEFGMTPNEYRKKHL